MAFRNRVVIFADDVVRWVGRDWKELTWHMVNDTGAHLPVVKYNGWTHCLTHGYERVFIAEDQVINRSAGGKRRLYVIVRAAEPFVGDFNLVDPRISGLEFNIRDEGDLSPHPQVVQDLHTGRTFGVGKWGRGGNRRN